MMTDVVDLARGYIASGEFNGHRIPQHIQNQIIKSYCDANTLRFVLSRAEYWINGGTDCQLWAALKEGFQHIVFYSIWQLPCSENMRQEIYKHCIVNRITLHFATERIQTKVDQEAFNDLEVLIKSNLLISQNINYHDYLNELRKCIEEK